MTAQGKKTCLGDQLQTLKTGLDTNVTALMYTNWIHMDTHLPSDGSLTFIYKPKLLTGQRL